MNVKFFSAVFSIMALFSLPLGRLPAHADIQPVMALDNMFTALNAGQVDTAAASFGTNAKIVDSIQGKEYVGVSGITRMLQGMQREGRQYHIARLDMDGSTVIAKVDVADSGIIWGTETLEAQVQNGKIQNLDETAFRLQLWGYQY